jgi:hypothetical protein
MAGIVATANSPSTKKRDNHMRRAEQPSWRAGDELRSAQSPSGGGKGSKSYRHLLQWDDRCVTLPPINKKIVAGSLLSGSEMDIGPSVDEVVITVAPQHRRWVAGNCRTAWLDRDFVERLWPDSWIGINRAGRARN